MKRRAIDMLLLLLITLPLASCDSGVPTAKVDGTVTLDGTPMPEIRVLFQPDNKSAETSGMGSFGLTDAEGKFTLKLSDSQADGAIVGNHSVILSDKLSEDPQDSDAGGIGLAPKSRIPTKYAKEPPRFEVKAGTTNQARIELTSK